MEPKDIIKRLECYDFLEGIWGKEGILIHNKAINKTLCVYYEPKLVLDRLAYGHIIDNKTELIKYIKKEQLQRVLDNLKKLKGNQN